MKQSINNSASGNVKEACRGLNNPKLVMLSVCNKDNLEQYAKELNELYPNIPTFAFVANSYDYKIYTDGCSAIGFNDIDVEVAVVEEVSTCPAKYISNIENAISAIKPGKNNTCCIDFCTGNDATVLVTLDRILTKNNIVLAGGTVDAGVVVLNGKTMENVDVCFFIKNLSGKVKSYKENLYEPMGKEFTYIASNTDRSRYYVGKLNGQSAKKVYTDRLGINESDITTQTFKNPLGKMIGQEICIISIKDVENEGLVCYRQVNDADVLTFLQIRDCKEVCDDTIRRIKSDFDHISGMFSINCAFRYLYFTDKLGSMDEYLKCLKDIPCHLGYVGFGEHYNKQFINQSMTCIVFE